MVEFLGAACPLGSPQQHCFRSVPERTEAQETYPNRLIRIRSPLELRRGHRCDCSPDRPALDDGLSQSVIVENKAGASGTVGHHAVVQAPADGYTVLLGTNSTYAIAPSILESLPYDNEKAFAPVGLVLRTPQMLCVHPSVPAKTVAELLDYVRARQPDKVNFGSAGLGATSHLAMELLMSMAGVRMQHIPYRGGAPAQQALIAGEVSVGFVDAIIAISSAEGGQLRMLGVSTTERLKLAPNVPTIAETVPGFQSATDVAMFVRAGLRTHHPPTSCRHGRGSEVAGGRRAAVEDRRNRGRRFTRGVPEIFCRGTGKWRNLIKTQNIKVQ